MAEPIWAIMPILSEPYTEQAIADLLDQSVPTRLLLINQGVDRDFRERLERIAEQDPERIFVWSHTPALPSLSATWNRGLRFCWATGATEALVVNNDVRLHPETVRYLHGILGHTPAYFVSAVGVTQEQFDAYDGTDQGWLTAPDAEGWGHPAAPGGPDFSCFMVSKDGHKKYPFDEKFIPAYGEDCSMHREYMLGGDGDKIFSINLPYLHIGGGSGTLKSLSPERRAALERRIGGSREYYARKWGGKPNDEKFTIPFDPTSAQPNVTNPELQAAILAKMSEA